MDDYQKTKKELIADLAQARKRVAQLEQAEAEKSEEKFRNLYNNSPFGIVICEMLMDDKGNFIDFIHLDANQATEKNTGFDLNTLIGAKASEMVDPKTLEELVELYGKVISSGEVISYEEYFDIYDRTLKVTAFPLHDNFFIINFINITDQKNVEHLLEKNNTKYAALIENIGDVIGIVDIDGKTIYQSPNIEKWFGWKPEELIGTNGWDKMHPDDIERIQKEFVEMLEDETPRTVEYRFKCKDGNYKWIELTAVNRLSNPVINGVLVNYRDITRQKKSRENLQKSEASLKLAQAIGNVGSWEYVISTDSITWSDEMYRIFGLKPQETLMTNEILQEFIHPDYRHYHIEIAEKLDTLGKSEFEYQMIRPDEEIRWIWGQGETTFDDNQTPVKRSGIAQDITERKAAEEELENYRNDLERKIEERTKEVQAKMEEHQTLFDLMIGREVRMAELKRVIKKLRTQIEDAGLTPIANDPLLDDLSNAI